MVKLNCKDSLDNKTCLLCIFMWTWPGWCVYTMFVMCLHQDAKFQSSTSSSQIIDHLWITLGPLLRIKISRASWFSVYWSLLSRLFVLIIFLLSSSSSGWIRFVSSISNYRAEIYCPRLPLMPSSHQCKTFFFFSIWIHFEFPFIRMHLLPFCNCYLHIGSYQDILICKYAASIFLQH